MENLIASVQLASECIRSGRTDEAQHHLTSLEEKLVKLQPVGKVGEVPALGGGIGYLNVPLPLGAVLFAERA